jgi:hypothetical protein
MGALFTVTVVVAVFWSGPAVAVSVYVVVSDGETDLLPDSATEPISGAIDTLEAPLTFQLIIALLPIVIDDGFALKSAIVILVVTSNVTDFDILPDLLLAVSVYDTGPSGLIW